MVMSPDRVQAAIDVAEFLEWIVRRVSLVLAAVIAVSVVLNIGKSGMLAQVLWALLILAAMNLMVTTLRRLFQSLKR